MQIFTTIGQAAPKGPAAVACGYFDGLHIGHAAVIGRAVCHASESNLRPCVFTFTMHGAHPERKQEGCDLITDENKYAILESWGVEAVLAPSFTEFKEMPPVEFVEEVLLRRLGAKAICCGHDFRFGKDASGDVKLLAELCNLRGIELDIIPAVTISGERVSSTRVRTLLGNGEVQSASKLLGRSFGYTLTVVEGKKLGRTIDSPTINQRIPEGFVRMRYGVYASVSNAGGKWMPSVTNIGIRPTVDDGTAVNSETYIIGYAGNLYGHKVEVRLLEFLRDEEKFPSVEALKAQIQQDAVRAEQIASRYLSENCGSSAE